MSNTHKHKDQGKFHSKVLKSDEVCESTKQMWDRHNGDRGEFRSLKKNKTEKILDKEMKEEIRIVIEWENIDFDIPEQDEILIEIFGKK